MLSRAARLLDLAALWGSGSCSRHSQCGSNAGRQLGTRHTELACPPPSSSEVQRAHNNFLRPKWNANRNFQLNKIQFVPPLYCVRVCVCAYCLLSDLAGSARAASYLTSSGGARARARLRHCFMSIMSVLSLTAALATGGAGGYGPMAEAM